MATSASIDVREGKYIITPFSYTTQRLGVMTEPIFIYDTLAEVITNLPKALDCSKSGLTPLSVFHLGWIFRLRSPTLRVCELRSI